MRNVKVDARIPDHRHKDDIRAVWVPELPQSLLSLFERHQAIEQDVLDSIGSQYLWQGISGKRGKPNQQELTEEIRLWLPVNEQNKTILSCFGGVPGGIA